MLLDYDPVTNLRHYPGIPMSRYGLNPYGEPVFRIIFAASRKTLVCDEMGNARYLPEYGQLGDIWVMEKWLSGVEFCGKPRERYDREEGLTNGPFPERGEYSMCHAFEACDPMQANVDKLVMWINEGKNRRFSEIRSACQAEYDQDTKDTQNRNDAIIRDAFSAYGNAPFVGAGSGKFGISGRNPKTQRILRSANELGLPTGNPGGGSGPAGVRNTTRSVQVMAA